MSQKKRNLMRFKELVAICDERPSELDNQQTTFIKNCLKPHILVTNLRDFTTPRLWWRTVFSIEEKLDIFSCQMSNSHKYLKGRALK